MLYLIPSCKQGTSQVTDPLTGNPDVITGTDNRFTVSDSSGMLSWSCRPGNIYYIPSEIPGEHYLYFTIKGNEPATAQKRPPLNISLVLDIVDIGHVQQMMLGLGKYHNVDVMMIGMMVLIVVIAIVMMIVMDY